MWIWESPPTHGGAPWLNKNPNGFEWTNLWKLTWLGGGFRHFLILPLLGGKWSTLTNIFQMGWFNHQQMTLENSHSNTIYNLKWNQPSNFSNHPPPVPPWINRLHQPGNSIPAALPPILHGQRSKVNHQKTSVFFLRMFDWNWWSLSWWCSFWWCFSVMFSSNTLLWLFHIVCFVLDWKGQKIWSPFSSLCV